MIGIIRWPLRWWHARQRRIDVDILWPAMRRAAPTLPDAHAAFLMHTRLDRAWDDLSEDEITAIVLELK